MSAKNQDWHAEDIKAAVRKRGVTLSQLSRDAGLAPDTLRNVFRYHWPKGELIVAGAIGVDPATIWPSRYN
ncbi:MULTISPECIES: helix-turn-helix domain-containing protein [Hafnia]|uniref:helix-turn-helix domain-containing protein n=1 Tax=Hafnia TaxID=568 RepID=UPI001C04722D|nr:helix-turn-helix transcriptional regulator [Hafnia paralvei]MBU2673537.1 helix-turn-helix domain-containing protein [Hafnia paralvei]